MRLKGARRGAFNPAGGCLMISSTQRAPPGSSNAASPPQFITRNNCCCRALNAHTPPIALPSSSTFYISQPQHPTSALNKRSRTKDMLLHTVYVRCVPLSAKCAREVQEVHFLRLKCCTWIMDFHWETINRRFSQGFLRF
jgi:hypothetical protein